MALMKPRLSEPAGRLEAPEIDACVLQLFGLTPEQAEAVERPSEWDSIETQPVADQIAAFAAEGWDLTDRRRPLRMFAHFNLPLWLALRGVAGQVPFQAEVESKGAWEAAMAREAARFRRR